MSSRTGNPGAPCEHKGPLGCELTTTTKCCMCADRRPLSEAYPTYVDGKGMEDTGTRYQKYCWKCRDHWAIEDALGRFNPSAYSEQTWSFPTTTTATSSTLSPFSGVRRRNERPHRSYANPLRSETDTDDVNDTISAPSSHIPRRSARRDHNRVDHDLTSTNSTTPSNSGHGATRLPRHHPHENPFGTRAEWEDPDYQSPLGMMFARAWTRYRDAEHARRQTEADIQDQTVRLTLNDSLQQQTPANEEPRDRHAGRAPAPYQAYASRSTHLAAQLELTRQARAAQSATSDIDRRITQHGYQHGHPSYTHTSPYLLARPPPGAYAATASSSPERENPIDLQSSRPPALSDEQMTVNIACKICYEQKMDMLLLPCYHIAVCQWCVSIMRSRVYEQGQANGITILRPVRGEGWKCPTCRKPVEGTKKIFLA